MGYSKSLELNVPTHIKRVQFCCIVYVTENYYVFISNILSVPHWELFCWIWLDTMLWSYSNDPWLLFWSVRIFIDKMAEMVVDHLLHSSSSSTSSYILPHYNCSVYVRWDLHDEYLSYYISMFLSAMKSYFFKFHIHSTGATYTLKL